MAVRVNLEAAELNRRLADPNLFREVQAAVRRRIQSDEALDVVQATFAEVLAARDVPADEEEFRRFVFGVARHKVFDHFRKRAREVPSDDANADEQAPEPLSARDLLRWAERELPDSESQHTLEWMLREGDGEKLEHIARDADVPAPRVRKRVSRLRSFLRQRWATELLLAGVVLSLGVYLYSRHRDEAEHANPEVAREDAPLELARKLRRAALERCRDGAVDECIAGLDRARSLDPAGDSAPEVAEARRRATSRPLPSPSTDAPTPVPSSDAPRPLPSSTERVPVEHGKGTSSDFSAPVSPRRHTSKVATPPAPDSDSSLAPRGIDLRGSKDESLPTPRRRLGDSK
ncbi:MAG TPA: RNA polymerase sigma factor [Polyangiaceae bacterium]|nr:RNA polymerase sigma factor [Polyangiaceae bacterium]